MSKFVREIHLREGSYVYADGGTDCVSKGFHRINKDEKGFYVNCGEGKHYLAPDVPNGEIIGFSINPLGNL